VYASELLQSPFEILPAKTALAEAFALDNP
jgi:hypothetical protein